MKNLEETATPLSWHERLRRTLAARRGVRLGEATVVSRQVHMVRSGHPETVIILSSADAGQQFYRRSMPGEIIHLDIHHAVARVDHRQVAGALRRALGHIPLAGPPGEGRLLLDYVDICTGTGGGRVTGDLTRITRPTVLVAHRNHVHIAGLLPEDYLHLLLTMVSAVEGEIRAQGVELRRVEHLLHQDGTGGQAVDLSYYQDHSDSLLRGRGQPGKGGAGAAAASRQAGSLGPDPGGGSGEGWGGGPGGGLGAGSGSDPGGTPGGGRGCQAGAETGQGGGGWQALEDERRLQAVLDLSRRLGSPDEVKRVLDELSREHGWGSLVGAVNSQAPFITRQLEEEGLVRRELRGLRLTEAGRELGLFLNAHLRDVKLRFRKLIRRLPPSVARQLPGATLSMARPSPHVRYGPIRGTAPAPPGAWLGDLAVPETIQAALKRTYLERAQSGESGLARAEEPNRPPLWLQRADIHVYLRAAEESLNICLLIDASASMAGRRILAAKHLARHLLVSTRDRIAVIAFQERDVAVYAPFTREYSVVEEGLARIQPMGLTPLAHGLTQSLVLIRESRVRHPLLLLITDGIPTVPMWTTDAAQDAMDAARLVGERRIPFGCIGLQPSRRYLEELANTAGGTLHVVEELAEEALISIAHRERIKLRQSLLRRVQAHSQTV